MLEQIEEAASASGGAPFRVERQIADLDLLGVEPFLVKSG